jgi:hypothetical protein
MREKVGRWIGERKSGHFVYWHVGQTSGIRCEVIVKLVSALTIASLSTGVAWGHGLFYWTWDYVEFLLDYKGSKPHKLGRALGIPMAIIVT